MSLPLRQLRAMLAAAALSVTVACDGERGGGPDTAGLAGTYTATSFTTESGGTSTDQLAAGATVLLQLNPQGTTAGRLFLPNAEEGGGDFEADLTGSWRVQGNSVELDHAADTFLRDMSLVMSGSTLGGEAMFGETTIRLELTKQ